MRAKPHVGRPAIKGPAAVAVAERLLREHKDDDRICCINLLELLYVVV